MEVTNSTAFFDAMLNFKITEVNSETRFWMIRTKKGYFYKEFIEKNFVALAWNTITSASNFDKDNLEPLADSILVDYLEIKRPTLVINKCKSFIHEIKAGDILVIPSAGSKFITFAVAGKYYEEDSKTYELEKSVTERIERHDVSFDDVTCPYKKRRRITPIRTIKGDSINHHLFKAITSYHGICNLDEYGDIILDHIYNCYSFNNKIRIVFHVGKTDPITSKEFSGFLYSVNEILTSTGIDENDISTQASVHSVGDIVFTIKNIVQYLSDNYIWFIAFAVIIGGGKFMTFEFPGLPSIIRDFISCRYENDLRKEEVINARLENEMKVIELKERMRNSGITEEKLQELISPIETLSKSSHSMLITPTNDDFCFEDLIISSSDSDDEEEIL